MLKLIISTRNKHAMKFKTSRKLLFLLAIKTAGSAQKLKESVGLAETQLFFVYA